MQSTSHAGKLASVSVMAAQTAGDAIINLALLPCKILA